MLVEFSSVEFRSSAMNSSVGKRVFRIPVQSSLRAVNKSLYIAVRVTDSYVENYTLMQLRLQRGINER